MILLIVLSDTIDMMNKTCVIRCLVERGEGDIQFGRVAIKALLIERENNIWPYI